jgi:hypothetical protein
MQDNNSLSINKLNEQNKVLTEIDLIIRSAQELRKIEIKQEEHEHRLSILEANSELNSGDTGYYTIKAWCKLNNIKLPLRQLRDKGCEASKISRIRKVHIGKVTDETYGTVNKYREDILKEIFKIHN